MIVITPVSMNAPTFIVIGMMTYYTFFIAGLLIPKNRNSIQEVNSKLTTLRHIPVKTVEEQKQFLTLKNPHKEWKWSWKKVPKFLLGLAIAAGVGYLYYKLFSFFEVTFTIGWALVLVITGPLVINLALRHFNLEQDTLTALLWRK